MVVAKVRHRLSVSKRTVQKFDVGRMNLKELNNVELKEQCHVKVTNRFAALENDDDDDDDDDADIDSAWENVR
jgi:hypothetical protein